MLHFNDMAHSNREINDSLGYNVLKSKLKIKRDHKRAGVSLQVTLTPAAAPLYTITEHQSHLPRR